MCDSTVGIETATQIKLIRKYLKLKIIEDNITFMDHKDERRHVYDLIKRTIVNGESHSALMIGPRGCGKTTLINSVLHQVSKEVDIENDAIIVKLNGLVHHDDKVALKAITAQMQLENAVGDRVFGTFAENLAFLLSCLQSGADRRCKSMVFLIEEFDMFCHSGRIQTLLYNLFDITHNKQSPMCVLGVTNRIDVMELLEKRVKSRFSHRHIFIFPHEEEDGLRKSPVNSCKEVMVNLLSMPSHRTVTRKKSKSHRKSETCQFSLPEEVLSRCHMDPKQSILDPSFVEDWNAHITALAADEKVTDALEKFCYYTVNAQIFRNILFQLVSRLCPSQPYISSVDLSAAIDSTVAPEHTVKLLQSLSILELSLLIAMKHATDIFDGQPMNFEMVLHRYTKFANANSSTQTVPRPVILKAFEHLQELEIIYPVRSEVERVQKEYKLYSVGVGRGTLDEAVASSRALPTEILHWYNSCTM